MRQADVFQMITWIDATLETLGSYQGRLNGTEIRIRSLLTVIRQELARDLIENTEPERADVLGLDDDYSSKSSL